MYLSNAEIVEAIRAHRAGDPVPMGRVIQLMGEGITGLMLRRGFEADAEEVTQEAAYIVMSKLDKVDLDGKPFNYLTTLIINQLRQAARVRAKHQRLDDRLLSAAGHERYAKGIRLLAQPGSSKRKPE